jgi:phosphoesterase RecJ-like protein
MQEKIIYSKIYEAIKKANNILLVTHEKPDGDGLSAVGAFIELLESLDKKYYAYCADAPAEVFYFLPHISKIKNIKPEFGDFDLIMVFDCGSLDRTKLAEEIKGRSKNQLAVNLDHHPRVDDFADLEVKKIVAAATTEIVYDFFKANNLVINKNVASLILTGIMADTGSFLYPSTSDKTLSIAAEMISQGAILPKIIDNIFKNKSLEGLKVWGQALKRLKLNSKYNLAWTILTKEDTRGVSEEELEGVANFLGNLKEADAVMFLREQEGGIIRGNLRSKKKDISRLANVLGGGGHKNAAGFMVEGKFNSQLLIIPA